MDTDVFLNDNNKMSKKESKKPNKKQVSSNLYDYIFLFPALLSNYGNLSHGWNIIK